jgi:hypothetical protein
MMSNMKEYCKENVAATWQRVESGVDKWNHGWSPLHWSSYYGRMFLTQAFTSSPEDFAALTRDGKTALELATENNKPEVVEFLTAAKRAIEAEDYSGMMKLTNNSTWEKKLLEQLEQENKVHTDKIEAQHNLIETQKQDIQTLAKEISSEMPHCCICLRPDLTVACVPCWHLCGCSEPNCLSLMIAAGDDLCPICKEPIASLQRMYPA